MLQDHIIRDSSDFMGGGWFGGHKHCDKVDISFLIYHVTSRDHVLKVLSNFVGKLLLLSRHLAKRYNRSNISRRKATQWKVCVTPMVSRTPTKLGCHSHSGSVDMFLVCHVTIG